MDIDYRDIYLKKMNRLGASRYERNLRHKQREFVKYFEDALNKEDCYINGEHAQLVFQDHSQSNNKDLSDDKYIIAPNETIIDIGSYIDWRDSEWLVFTEEFKTIPTHQQLKIKAVNWNLKWLVDGAVVNNGLGYGAYVQNQTLYTLGVSFSGDNIAIVNGKMMMYVQDNDDTRSYFTIGKRIFVGENVYKILFADTVSRRGLINLLMEEDTITVYDNRELHIADYYNNVQEDQPAQVEPVMATISGELKPRISRTYIYTISDGYEVSEWIIESVDGVDQPMYTRERDALSVTLQFKDDYRYVGQTVNVIAKLTDGSFVSLPIRVIKKFG